MKNKKGVELTMNTIIIAVIALIVLAVVMIIFSGSISDSSEGISGISSCEARGDGAECVTSAEACEGTALPKVGGCEDYCCIPR